MVRPQNYVRPEDELVRRKDLDALEETLPQAFGIGVQKAIEAYHEMYVAPLLERIAALEHLLPGEDNPIANGYAGVCPRDGAALVWADIQGTMRKWCRVCMSRSPEPVPGAEAVTAEGVLTVVVTEDIVAETDAIDP